MKTYFLILSSIIIELNSYAQVWTRKADVSGSPRWYTISFSIGSNGYIGTGYDAGGFTNDFWEYNPSLNVWTQKANFGGVARWDAVSFNIGGNGYVGTGYGTGGY